MFARRQSGFTLIQLLVAVGILAILFGMLFPALLKLRQAADRMKSQNNLKQIALACCNYEAAFAKFPPGNDGHNFSAVVRLLPYLDGTTVFRQVDFQKDVTDEANANIRKMRIPVFLSTRDPQASVKEGIGPTNYLLSAGSKVDMNNNDGIFFQESKIGVARITDGTSNTIMLGER